MPKPSFLSDLQKIQAKSLRIKAYRVIALNLPPLSLEGSLRFGGRYNPPYQFGAIYCGECEATCWAEIEKKAEGPILQKRFSVVALRLHLQKVLDLCDPEVLSRLKLKQTDLVHPTDHAMTRLIAENARDAGFEAILAPASTGSGQILAVFSDRLNEKSSMTLVKPRRSRTA